MYRFQKYYIDGGVLNNCPLTNLLSTLPEEEYNNVLCIDVFKSTHPFCLEELSMMEYVEYIIDKCYYQLSSYKTNKEYESKCMYISYETFTVFSPKLWDKFLHDEEYRKGLIQIGKDITDMKLKLK